MRIAIFDYKVIAGNPTGNCHLTLLRSLAQEHKFTVFSVEFENPDPAAITWVRVPSPTRPLALLFVVFHLLAPLAYLWHKMRTGNRFDVVQSIESDLCFGGLVYSHFSHTTYLRHHGTTRRGLRGILRWIDHWLHACAERFRYPAAQLIVTPSIGLADELKRDFHIPPERVSVISNPIPVKRMERPADFDRDDFRRRLGFAASDFVLAFAALGQFERKGLPLILESLAAPGLSETKLLVIGGEPDLIADYRQRADALGVGNRVCFAGMQGDVRPFFWSGDAFVLPSAYESFSLVTLRGGCRWAAYTRSSLEWNPRSAARGRKRILDHSQHGIYNGRGGKNNDLAREAAASHGRKGLSGGRLLFREKLRRCMAKSLQQLASSSFPFSFSCTFSAR